jgi:hypothetical protein
MKKAIKAVGILATVMVVVVVVIFCAMDEDITNMI